MISDTLVRKLQVIAQEYDLLPHWPDRTDVAAAYTQLQDELWGQWMSRTLDITFTTIDPYPTSRAMFADCATGLLKVYTGADLPKEHPMGRMSPCGQSWNSVFRAVHDGMIHWPGRYGFSPLGELRAFRAHHALLSPLAGHAIATETLAQNAWYCYGPFSDQGVRPYAPQKATLLPLTLIQEILTDESI